VRGVLKKLAATASAFVFVALVAAVAVYLDLIFYADKPVDATVDERVVLVKRGQSFAGAVDMLQEQNIIRSPGRFRLLARIKGADTRIQAGEYLLKGSMTPNQILQTLIDGKVRLYRFTVPEGSNLQQIAGIVSEAGFTPAEQFVQVATNPDLIRRLGLEADSLEGYLFPDTYHFPRNATAEDITIAMVQRFQSLIPEGWKTRADELGLSMHEVVTLASIIEKETGTPEERPLISSVFHNRLKRGMRLQTDPTVIYGIEDFDGNLTRKHLNTHTPYNTYLIRGLPPGPIANPGLASIEAALFPEETKYLYFVSRKDSTHQFSTNLKDHNQAIRKYQLRR
jgi:UPF0755 protein